MRTHSLRSLSGLLPWAILAGVAVTGAAASAADPSSSTAAADAKAAPQPITFDDVSLNPANGIAYRRKASATKASFDAVKIKPFMSLEELNATPQKYAGAPGVALGDFDKDGDIDIYVTNGPGRGNSLYKNLFKESGAVKFTDVAGSAGVDATDMDSTGVCYGDIDNDGDEDIYVLGRMEPNRLFENLGNGTFRNITTDANAGAGVYGHIACSMGDINGDGLLDIFIGNAFDQARFEAIYNDYFALNHPNQILVNKGNRQFEDKSEASGIRKIYNVPPGDATITWAVALVDIDQDGDVDAVQADDQGALAPGVFAGIDRGYVQVWKNDGAGNFTNATLQMGTNHQSSWMGISFGDYNRDGIMDMFATSTGDYLVQQFGMPIPPDLATSRWFLGGANGVFALPPAPPSAFGWSTSSFDYDNDGDTDVTYYGNLNVGPFVTADNPGVILDGDGSANFALNLQPTSQTWDKVRRGDCNGMATGDLNNDGFPDIVHVSGQYIDPAKLPLVKMKAQWGSPFDATALYAPTFMPIGPFEWEWSGKEPDEGFMGVQINSARNRNGWVKVALLGTKGITTAGKSNRDGIGAVVHFTPKNGQPQLFPVLGGSGAASQMSLIQSFGLGKTADRGMVEVMWPGGVRNRLYDVRNGEQVTIPEIGCNFATASSKNSYLACVNSALSQLNGKISRDLSDRLRDSAKEAYEDTH